MAASMTSTHFRGERGNALVEFALVLPVLLLVFAGIVDFGFLFQRYEVVTNAAREGARLAVLPGYTPGDVQARVVDYLRAGLGAGAPTAKQTSVVVDTVPVVEPAGSSFLAVRVTVAISYDYLLLGPIVNLATGRTWAQSITVRAVSAMRPEIVGG